MPIEAHDGDLSTCIRLDVEVHGARAEPFVEAPLLLSGQMDGEVSRIVLCPMCTCSTEFFIVQSLPARTDSWDGTGREKILPRPHASLPPLAFGSQPDS
jgi:hypothetical protein